NTLRLTVKSLLKFRSVSKSWLSLISSPEFVNTHLSICVNNTEYTHHRLMLGLDKGLKVYSVRSLLYEDESVEATNLDFPTKGYFSIVGSVNGLICLRTGPNNLLLWNPSMRKLKNCTAFIAAPKGVFYLWGFGYDEVHDDYKVVRMFYAVNGGNSCDVNVEIYSLKSDSCKEIDGFQCGKIHSCLGKLVNGKLHWITSGAHPGSNDGDIIFIDLADEKWGMLEQPCHGEGEFYFKLGVLGSDLSIFRTYQSAWADVWVMKEYGVKESWAKIYTIKFDEDFPKRVRSPLFCKSNKGEILLALGSRFMIYNPKANSLQYPKISESYFSFSNGIYVESLVCPFLQNEPTMKAKSTQVNDNCVANDMDVPLGSKNEEHQRHGNCGW
uniref:F-box protein CPR30-like n=2 Tax=Nicotiana sylvestris TaxID=4096 RepID=A0A1U7WG31_NICSY